MSFWTRKLDARLGALTKFLKSSDLHSEVELDHLSVMGIENRAICRAIGLKLVGRNLCLCGKQFEQSNPKIAALSIGESDRIVSVS